MSSHKPDKKPKNNPMIDLSDSINRSMIGDLGAIAEGGCLSRIIIMLIILIIGVLIIKYK